MNDTVFVNLEIDLTLFHLFNGFRNVHSHGSAFGVWHKTAWAEYTAERADLTHDCGLGDDNVDVGPSTLDLVNVFVETHVVGACCFCSCFGIGVTENENSHLFACSVRKGYNTAHHLVGFTRVNAESHVDVDRCVKFGVVNFLNFG